MNAPCDAGKPPALSVIVCAYNNADCIGPTIEALARSDFRDFETILYDDASDDATIDLFEKLSPALPRPARIIRAPRNRGFLISCNEASLRAGGEILVLLNSDACVWPDTLGILKQTLDSNPDIGLLGCKVYHADGRTLQSVGNRLRPNGLSIPIGRDEPDKGQFAGLLDCDYATGACVAIPRSLWFALNGFDEDFAPAYYEDVDLGFRVRERGLRVAVACEARLTHIEGASYRKGLDWNYIALNMTNRCRLLAKRLWRHRGFRLRAIGCELRWMCSWRSKYYRRASMRGYLAALRQWGVSGARILGLARRDSLERRRARLRADAGMK